MSQKLTVSGFKLNGRPFTGIDTDGVDRFAATGADTAVWLADASRTRFNQQRSLRSKYVYVDGERTLDDTGAPVLVPIGATVTRHTHAEARRLFQHLAAVPAMVLHYQARDENASWPAAVKRRATNLTRGGRTGAMPGFRSRHRPPLTFGCFARNGATEIVTLQKTGRRSGVLRNIG